MTSWKNVLLATVAALAAAPATAGEIHWDRYGVPHIYGASIEEVMRGYGYAQMENHAEQLLLNVAAARGRYAEYFGAGVGEANVRNDIYVHSVGIPERSERWLTAGGARQRGYIEAFIAGANAYAARHGERISPRIRRVLPLVPADVMALGQWTLQFNFANYDALDLIEGWKSGAMSVQHNPIYASNAWAVAPRRTVGGNAMLIGNPHLPWAANGPSVGPSDQLPEPLMGMMHYMQAHLVVGDPADPQINLSGVSFVGSPFISIGFNDHLGWTYTVNNIRPADVFELQLDGESYRFGRETKRLESTRTTIRICELDRPCESRPLIIERSVHGPILARRGDKAVAMHLAGLEAPGLVEQYWDMARSRTLEEFVSAYRRLQIPYFNLIYADRDGRIVYAYAGRIPVRKGGTYSDWTSIMPGDNPALLSERVLSWEELPKAIDPPSGFVQNSNDGPWTSTFPQVLRPEDFPGYIARDEMDLRPQAGALFLQSKPRFTVDELRKGVRSTRLMMADRVLPDLLRAAGETADPLVRRAADVLKRWDGLSNADSRGAALFEQWYELQAAALEKEPGKSLYRERWDPARPLTTPQGLADPAAAVAHLAAAARILEARFGRIDAAWGEGHRIRLVTRDADYLNPRTVSDLPASGNDHRMSSLHMMGFLPPDENGIRSAMSGETYTQIVEFTPQGANARWILSYGNASRPGSPHVTDQLPAFLSGELLPVPRSRKEVEAATVRVEPF